jgi:hypothetical protein
MLAVYMENRQMEEKPLREWIPIADATAAAAHFSFYGEKVPRLQ